MNKIAVTLAVVILAVPLAVAQEEPRHPLSHIDPVDKDLNMSEREIFNISGVHTDALIADGSDLVFQDSVGEDIMLWDSGEVEWRVFDGIDMSGSELKELDQIETEGRDLEIVDTSGDDPVDIARFQEGGDVEIPSGDLRLGTGQSIEDGSGIQRVRMHSDATQIFNDAGIIGVNLVSGVGHRIRAYPDEPVQIRDMEGDYGAINYRTSEDLPGTLEMTNADLDMSGQSIENFFAADCDPGEVVAGVDDDGTYNCRDVSGEVSGDYVSTDGDTMTGDLNMREGADIDMGGNDIIDIGDLTGTGIVDSGQISSGAVGSSEIGSNEVGSDELVDDSVTYSSGDHLTGGGEVALGGSTTLNVDPSGIDWDDTSMDQSEVNADDIPLSDHAGDELVWDGTNEEYDVSLSSLSPDSGLTGSSYDGSSAETWSVDWTDANDLSTGGSLDSGVVTDTEVDSISLSSISDSGDLAALDTVGSSEIDADSIGTSELSDAMCNEDEILEFDGTNWGCVDIEAAGGDTDLTGGSGIDPDSITDGDTLTVVWSDANDLGTDGDISDFSGAVHLSEDGSLTGVGWGDLDGVDQSDVSASDVGLGNVENIAQSSMDGSGLSWDGTNEELEVNTGNALTISSDNVAVASESIGSNEIASGAVGSTELASDSVTDSELSDAMCGSDEILRFDGTNWVCTDIEAAGGDTDLSGGDGIDPESITDGDTINVDWVDANDLTTGGSLESGVVTDSEVDSISLSSISDSGDLAGMDSVSSSEIDSGAVRTTELASDSVTDTELDNSDSFTMDGLTTSSNIDTQGNSVTSSGGEMCIGDQCT